MSVVQQNNNLLQELVEEYRDMYRRNNYIIHIHYFYVSGSSQYDLILMQS